MIRKNWLFILGFVLTLCLLWPLFRPGYFSHHDDVQTIRLYEMDRCIQDFQIPCRWVPDLGGLYGYPLFNYYAPLPYYFGEIFYLLSGSLIFSAKMMFAASFLGAFVFMFLLGRKLWGERGGFLSAVFYSYAPYHGVDLYVRGAMGELWALMFFPAIIWSILKLKEKISSKNMIVVALCVAGLLLSHNLSALIFLPFSVIFSLIILFFNKSKKLLIYLGSAFVLGILLSAFYLIPVILEKGLVHVDTTTYGYFSYTEHFKGLRKVILDRSWGWGSSIREVPGSDKDGLSFQVGWVHLIAVIFSFISLLTLWKKDKQKSLILIFGLSVFVFSIFMIHPRSEPLWKLFEQQLKYLQFPWRFLMLTIFAISLLVGSLSLLKNRFTKFLLISLTISVVILNFSYFRPEKFKDITDQDLLAGELWDKNIKRSIFDYLPIYAKFPPAELATSRYEILSGEANIQDYKEGSNWIKFKADVKSLSYIRLSQYYFPDWRINIDGKKININFENDLGLMTFAMDPGVHVIEAKLHDTPPRLIGNVVSLVTLFIIFGIISYKNKKILKFASYVLKGWNR